jgi:hypothetical protein
MTVKECMIERNIEPRKFHAKPMIPDNFTNRNTKESRAFNSLRRAYKGMLQATAAIDFKCNFDSDGVCDGKRPNPCFDHPCFDPRQAMCCCQGCMNTSGYFHDRVLATRRELVYYTNRWDPYLGFWREGKGCILDRGRRSITCVYHNCLYKLSHDRGRQKEKAIFDLKGAAEAVYSILERMIKEAK